MNPFFIEEQFCRALIVSNKAYKEVKELLKPYNIQIIKTKDNDKLPLGLRDHPDLSIHPITYNKFIVAKNVFEYYKSALKGYNVELIPARDDVTDSYPFDCLLNVGRLSNYYIHNNTIDGALEDEFKKLELYHIYTKQGYSKCSTLNINYDTIITQDMGIYKALKKLNMNSYLVPQGGIILKGYNTGLLGGVGGLLGKKLMFFYGNPDTYIHGELLISYLHMHGMEYIYPNLEFLDLGGIIPIKEWSYGNY